MKKKFCLCFLGCIFAGLLSTNPVVAYSFLSDGDLKTPGDATKMAWQEDGETNATLHYGGGSHDRNGNWISRHNLLNSDRWRNHHRHANSNSSHAPIPSAILLFGSGILGLVGIKIRSRKRS